MTKDHKILSLQLSAQELADLDTEAQAAPFLGNRSDYCRSILAGRHTMTIVAAPQAQQQTDHYTQLLQQQALDHQDLVQRLEQDQQVWVQQQEQDHQYQLARHQAQIDQLTQQLAASNTRLREQQQASAHLQEEYDKLFIKQQVQEHLQEERAQNLEQSTQQVQEWKDKHQEAQRRADELTQQLGDAKGVATWVDVLTKGMGNVVGNNPVLAQRVADEGLSGLWSGKPKPAANAGDLKALALGQAMYTDFPSTKLEPIIDILQYLRDDPQALAELQAQPKARTYIAKLHAAKIQPKAKATK